MSDTIPTPDDEVPPTVDPSTIPNPNGAPTDPDDTDTDDGENTETDPDDVEGGDNATT